MGKGNYTIKGRNIIFRLRHTNGIGQSADSDISIKTLVPSNAQTARSKLWAKSSLNRRFTESFMTLNIISFAYIKINDI